MKTFTMLFARFESPTVRLEEISEEFFGISAKFAGRHAQKGDIPVPTFRLGSAKSGWLIHLEDLANYIDKQRQQAQKDHQNLTA